MTRNLEIDKNEIVSQTKLLNFMHYNPSFIVIWNQNCVGFEL